MSDGFHVFNTGNRKKILQAAKKKKQKSASVNHEAKAILKIQKNIRRFLELSLYSRKEQPQQKLLFANMYDYLPAPLLIFQHISNNQNQVITKKLLMVLLKLCMNLHQTPNRQQQLNNIKEALINIPNYIIQMIRQCFWLFNNVQIRYFIQYLFPLCSFWEQFSIYDVADELSQQIALIVQYLLLNSDRLIIFLSQINSNNVRQTNFFYEFLSIMSSNSQKGIKVEVKKLQKDTEIVASVSSKQMAYQNLRKLVFSYDIQDLQMNQNVKTKILIALLKIMTTLIEQQQKIIMDTYNIDKILLKISRKDTLSTIHQKDEWICFMDYMDIDNKFMKSLVQEFIINQNFQYCLHISNLLNIFFQNQENIIENIVRDEDINYCFYKIHKWVKVHQIGVDIEQQQILYTFLQILYTKLFSMGHTKFQKLYRHNPQELQSNIKNTLISIVCRVIFIKTPSQITDKIADISTDLLQNLYTKAFMTHAISTNVFQNQLWGQKLRDCKMENSYDELNLFIKRFPFIFGLRLRLQKFRQIMGNNYRNFLHTQKYYLGQIKIRRNHQFQDAFEQLYGKNIKGRFQVIFYDIFGAKQTGIDAGGLSKQFINRVLNQIFDPKFGMFIQNHQGELLPHPNKAQSIDEADAQYFEFVGQILGKCLYEGITIGPKLLGPFLNILIGKTNSFQDLRKIDKDFYQSLLSIKEMEEDASQLELTFMFKDQIRNKNINLKPNGANIKVTNQNKGQYIKLLTNYKVNKLLQFQSRNIAKGLQKMINKEWLYMFNYEQLSYLISGSGIVDINELKHFTKYSKYAPHDQTIIDFWDVVSEFNQQQKSKLLMFVTSSPRPSYLGFKDLNPPFTLLKNSASSNSLPVSHTCVNLLELPDYKNRQLLKEKLLQAINSTGFYVA